VALDSELNREVALKQILKRHADDPAARQRFLLEAEITGGLEHPGIVPVYGAGTYDGGRPYYAMRFVKGESLKEAIDRIHGEPGRVGAGSRPAGKTRGADATPLAFRKLLRRFLDVCNAIGYAHDRGVFHRDIKPDNVIVGKHGETLVVDWGLAKATGRPNPTADEQPLWPDSAIGADTMPNRSRGQPVARGGGIAGKLRAAGEQPRPPEPAPRPRNAGNHQRGSENIADVTAARQSGRLDQLGPERSSWVPAPRSQSASLSGVKSTPSTEPAAPSMGCKYASIVPLHWGSHVRATQQLELFGIGHGRARC
jgi:serine/threonine protein kinase